MTESIYIPRGVNVFSLSRETQWYFQPTKEFRVSSPSVIMLVTCSLKKSSLHQREMKGRKRERGRERETEGGRERGEGGGRERGGERENVFNSFLYFAI